MTRITLPSFAKSLISIPMLLVAACAGTDGRLPPAHTVSQSADDAALQYQIGPLDTLAVSVWQQPDLTMQLQVRPDGYISMPLANEVKAAGKTTEELVADLTKAFGETIRNPIVTVMVTSFNGTYDNQIRVLGEAANPQSIQYQSDMTLMDVMIRVGGLTENAAGNRARLIRFENGTKRVYDVRIESLLLNGNIDANVRVRPGDVIVIPATFF